MVIVQTMVNKVQENKIYLVRTKRTDPRLLQRMALHYSTPAGFVGRNICYACYFNEDYYGHIVAGSATRYLPNRNEFFGISMAQLNSVINNIFFNVSPLSETKKYPMRNFTSNIVKTFMAQVQEDWLLKYGDKCIGFETLIEKPRTGELYLKAGWKKIGETKGYTCKRIGGRGTDSWTGQRIWNTEDLHPKLVLVSPC